MLSVQDVDLTPNPHALKFILNERLLNLETRHYHNVGEAAEDPFAESIFKIDGVVSVFYMDKFVTIEKSKETSWAEEAGGGVVTVGGRYKDLLSNF